MPMKWAANSSEAEVPPAMRAINVASMQHRLRYASVCKLSYCHFDKAAEKSYEAKASNILNKLC